MSLTPGSRLGPYEIVSALGAGGMGEVWKARDARLNRVVAIKTFRERFSERFEREARAVAALNHPHVCHLYDIGPDYLVMEFIDGSPVKGPLPVSNVLQYGCEILAALECAHRSGIVHRDLKPANILVTKSGVKLVDFGLAKTIGAADNSGETTFARTEKHTVTGTLGYMSPEQLQGKDVDSRSDVFSFGCVLYEMLTGSGAFVGDNSASLIAMVLKEDVTPPSAAMRGRDATIPPALDSVVTACLAKDPDERWQTARDLRRELIRIGKESPFAGPASPRPLGGRRERIWMGVAVTAIMACALLGTAYVRRTAPSESAVRAAILPPAEGAIFVTNPNLGGVALSPDGRLLAFGAEVNGKASLFIRELASSETRSLIGTENAGKPFWSPDGRSIGFFSSQGLKRVDLAGGNPVTLSDGSPRGGAWNRDGTILFTHAITSGKPGGLYSVAATGGETDRVTTLDASNGEIAHYWPQFLPDGKHFLFLARNTQVDKSGIYVGSLDDAPAQRKRVRLVSSAFGALFAPSPGGAGYLLFVDGPTLFAQRFDQDHLELEGERVALAQGVSVVDSNGAADVAVSADGRIVYGTGGRYRQRLVWRDRSGTARDAAPNPEQYLDFELSPDGHRALATIAEVGGGETSIYVLDFVRGSKTQVVREPPGFFNAIWSPDGRQVIYDTPQGIFRIASNGAGTPEQIVTEDARPTSWSRDGRLLMYETAGASKKEELWIVPLTGDRKPSPFLQGAANFRVGQFSPDGRWVAYYSDETGSREVFIQSFPAGKGKWQVSSSGGVTPKWREDGKELFYVLPGQRLLKMMAAEVLLSRDGLDIAAPRALFEWPAVTNTPFGVAEHGQRFLVYEPVERPNMPLTLLLHWQDGLGR